MILVALRIKLRKNLPLGRKEYNDEMNIIFGLGQKPTERTEEIKALVKKQTMGTPRTTDKDHKWVMF